jgi:hypothetical protein
LGVLGEEIRISEARLESLVKASTVPRPRPNNPNPNTEVADAKLRPAVPGSPAGDM